ncbi:MAG: hypothetical protein M0Z55_07800 [Peptococcaceae bacterium]|nr:hypothetical protein [Peptococcaceae bacterium]
MIQIDDAGNGAVLGGEVIGALRVETNEFFYRVLPLQAYASFEINRTHAAKDAVLDLLGELNHIPGEDLFLCTGDVFKETKDALSAHNITWQEQKITGSLQELVEESFFNSLRPYGVPEKFRAFYQDYQKFHNMILGWVCQDLEHRAQYCKPLRLNSGLVARSKIYQTIAQKNLACSTCQAEIPVLKMAIIDKTGDTPLYFHPECYPVTLTVADFQTELVQDSIAHSFINRFPSPPQCSSCGQLIKYKKRVILFRDKLYHFACFAQLMRSTK